MNPHLRTGCLWTIFLSFTMVMAPMAVPAEEPSLLTAQDLAARLNTARQDGDSLIRLRLEIKGPSESEVLQLQVKSRRTPSATDVIYQVLWPKERQAESVWISKVAGGSIQSAFVFSSAGSHPIGSSEMTQSLFGSDLAYEDVVDNFYAWDKQSITGTEMLDGVQCHLLESKPGKISSSYGKVLSWIDVRRLVALRVEKYLPSGAMARRIDTTRVIAHEGRFIPSNMTVQRPGQKTITQLEGSKIRHDVNYSDADFKIPSKTE